MAIAVLCLFVMGEVCHAMSPAITLDLGGDSWRLKNSTMKEVAATVPGVVHTDLLRAGVIDEPFYGDNPDLLRWVALSDWTYERNFTVSPDMMAAKNIQLISMGIGAFMKKDYYFDLPESF